MLNIRLKEWSIVCDLLMEGSLAVLLRKGGIHEDKGPGIFELEHPRFALFPSYLHQKPEMIKPQHRARVQVLDEPAEVTLKAVGEAAKIWEIPSRAAFDRLDDLHCWTPAQIDMRFNYKPHNPIYLMAVRVWRLDEPRTVANDWTYGGCKSWVPLKPHDAVDDTRLTPALTNVQFASIVARVDETFAAAG